MVWSKGSYHCSLESLCLPLAYTPTRAPERERERERKRGVILPLPAAITSRLSSNIGHGFRVSYLDRPNERFKPLPRIVSPRCFIQPSLPAIENVLRFNIPFEQVTLFSFSALPPSLIPRISVSWLGRPGLAIRNAKRESIAIMTLWFFEDRVWYLIQSLKSISELLFIG